MTPLPTMGTYNYQIQVYNPVEDAYLLTGENSYKKAIDYLLQIAMDYGSSHGYLWPQTLTAEGKIKRQFNADYLKISISMNLPEKKQYKIEGQRI